LKLEKGKVAIDSNELRRIVRTHFPRFRQIAAFVQINSTVDMSVIYKPKVPEPEPLIH